MLLLERTTHPPQLCFVFFSLKARVLKNPRLCWYFFCVLSLKWEKLYWLNLRIGKVKDFCDIKFHKWNFWKYFVSQSFAKIPRKSRICVSFSKSGSQNLARGPFRKYVRIKPNSSVTNRCPFVFVRSSLQTNAQRLITSPRCN